MAASINGIGTTFYGSALKGPDGSYVVTQWVIFVYVPLIPMGSMRVLPVADNRPWWNPSLGTTYKSQKVPLYMPHVWKGYAVTLTLSLLLYIFG